MVPKGFLEFTKGQAFDDLNCPFIIDQDESSEAFVVALTGVINAGMASDTAGDTIATFIQALPYKGSCMHLNAWIGMHVLTETLRALVALNEDHDKFSKSLADEPGQPDSSTDREIRGGAHEYDQVHDYRRLNEIASQGAKGFRDEIPDEEIAANTGEAPAEEIAASAANTGADPLAVDIRLKEMCDMPGGARIEPREEPAQKAHCESPVAEEQSEGSSGNPQVDQSPAMRLFSEESVKVTIEAPDYHGQPPARVFEQAKVWLSKHLVAVACGSFRDGSYPRLAPLLVETGGDKFSFTQEEIGRLINKINAQIRMLRFSGGSDGPDIASILDAFGGDEGPKNFGEMAQFINNFLGGILNGSADPGASDVSSFGEEGMPWEEGDSEDWRGESQ
jgi:hypothetical protein